MRISDWSSDVCSSDLAARERVPMADAWASSADACPSAVPIGAAAAVPWLAIPSQPDVKEVNTLPLKRKTVKRSEVHTSELQSLMCISIAVLCLNTKTKSPNSHLFPSIPQRQHCNTIQIT